MANSSMTFSESGTTATLLAAIEQGDDTAVNELLALHRNYLRRLIDVRLDLQLRGRIDPSDVVQEALVEASRSIQDFLTCRPTTFRVWLRRKAIDQLIDQRRFHRRQKRDVANEIAMNDPSSMAIATALMHDSARRRSIRQELLKQVRAALDNLSESDREVMLLRHAEELSNAEAAEVLEIEPKAASARYGRALTRLSTELRRLGVREM